MLHELLISLRGHSGYVFVDKEDKMMVNPTLTFLHPCEVSVKVSDAISGVERNKC